MSYCRQYRTIIGDCELERSISSLLFHLYSIPSEIRLHYPQSTSNSPEEHTLAAHTTSFISDFIHEHKNLLSMRFYAGFETLLMFQ